MAVGKCIINSQKSEFPNLLMQLCEKFSIQKIISNFSNKAIFYLTNYMETYPVQSAECQQQTNSLAENGTYDLYYSCYFSDVRIFSVDNDNVMISDIILTPYC